jgi:hypothetical protein
MDRTANSLKDQLLVVEQWSCLILTLSGLVIASLSSAWPLPPDA